MDLSCDSRGSACMHCCMCLLIIIHKSLEIMNKDACVGECVEGGRSVFCEAQMFEDN